MKTYTPAEMMEILTKHPEALSEILAGTYISEEDAEAIQRLVYELMAIKLILALA